MDIRLVKDSDLLKRSSLYREFQAEREEVLRHKWIESEKAGYDIGFEHALIDWIIHHRSKWRTWRKQNCPECPYYMKKPESNPLLPNIKF